MIRIVGLPPRLHLLSPSTDATPTVSQKPLPPRKRHELSQRIEMQRLRQMHRQLHSRRQLLPKSRLPGLPHCVFSIDAKTPNY